METLNGKKELKRYRITGNLFTNNNTFLLGTIAVTINAIDKVFAEAKFCCMFSPEIYVENIKIMEIWT
jgi:hypothetical protein